MGGLTCPQCARSGRQIHERSGVCWACHVRGISFGFGGYGPREWAAQPTIGEQLALAKQKAEERGDRLEPVGTRWV